MTEMTYLEIANLNENSRRLAVADMTDQTMLEKFAKNDCESSVRNIAVGKLIDQNVLGYIAKNESYSFVRRSAVEKLTDQNVLVEIAKSCSSYDNGILAVEKLTDQSLLIDCTLNALDGDVRDLARKGITDQNAFEEALMNSPPHVKRRYLLLYLKIRFFGTFAFRQAKRICKNRDVTPRLLQQLNGSLSGWTFSGKEQMRFETLISSLKTKLEKTRNDIAELEKEREVATDVAIRSSYDSVITALSGQKAVFEKALDETSSCLAEMQHQKEHALSVFCEAEKAAEMYRKHDEVMSRVLEHQTDVKGLLKAHADI